MSISSVSPLKDREPADLIHDEESLEYLGRIEESPEKWPTSKLLIFRAIIVFFVLIFAPVFDWHFWRTLFHTNPARLLDLFRLATFVPHYFYAPKWGFASFRSVGIIAVISGLVAAIWTSLHRDIRHNQAIYYWVRVLVRYRLAIALIAYGLLQVVPLQFPRPTLSDLQTNYGEFLQWKLFYLTNGVATAWYGQAIGILEVVAGIMLLWNKTTTFGAGAALALLNNVLLVNFAYQLGNHVLASVLTAAAFFLLYHDLRRLIDLLILQRRAIADEAPHFPLSEGLRKLRPLAKAAVLVFALIYTGEALYADKAKNWPFPEEKGAIANTAGVYDVREFTVNGRTIPYSKTDPVRWQNVVFERWNTISVRNNQPVSIAVSNPEVDYNIDPRAYEAAGNGGRHFYSYTADTAQKTLVLKGTNEANQSFTFHYEFQPDDLVVLTGNDQSGNALRVVLKKLDKQYLLLMGRRKPLNLY